MDTLKAMTSLVVLPLAGAISQANNNGDKETTGDSTAIGWLQWALAHH